MGILIPYTACEVGVTAGKVVPIRCLTVLLSLEPETRGTALGVGSGQKPGSPARLARA